MGEILIVHRAQTCEASSERHGSNSGAGCLPSALQSRKKGTLVTPNGSSQKTKLLPSKAMQGLSLSPPLKVP